MSGQGGATIETAPSPWRYAVISPKRTLPAGSCRVYLRGRVIAGGLDLGVLDVGANQWIVQRMYWHGQKGFETSWMMTPFSLQKPTTVQFILSNWVPKAMNSRWELREMRLVSAG